jgi:hypothetical protein
VSAATRRRRATMTRDVPVLPIDSFRLVDALGGQNG